MKRTILLTVSALVLAGFLAREGAAEDEGSYMAKVVLKMQPASLKVKKVTGLVFPLDETNNQAAVQVGPDGTMFGYLKLPFFSQDPVHLSAGAKVTLEDESKCSYTAENDILVNGQPIITLYGICG